MSSSFWKDNNAWWIQAAARMSAGKMTREDWSEANRRLWCLLLRVADCRELGHDDREDMVQHLLLRLQENEVVDRLQEVDTPAHFLAAMMRNRTRNDQRHQRVGRRKFRTYAAKLRRRQEDRPDQEVEKRELADLARFKVLHVLPADDRTVLLHFYWKGMSQAEIATELRITEAAAAQRLARARRRLKESFEV